MYNSLLQFEDKTDNIVLDYNHTIHLKGFCYRVSFFYGNTLTQIPIFFNPRKLTIERFLELLFWDLAEFIDDTDFLESFCYDIKKQIEEPCKNYFDYVEKNKNPSEMVFISSRNENKSYDFQYYSTFFDKGESKFDTLSINLQASLIKYRNEVYELLDCRNYYFHNFRIEFYLDLDYLNFLKSRLSGSINKFINLRFCKDKLVITFKRDINDNIRVSGTVLEVLDNFLLFGFDQLYTLLELFDFDTTIFKESLRLKTYTHYELAKDIGCNVEIEQPELLNRLRLNQMNDMESLANIGLKYHHHYIDFSREDEYGYRVPEYEIEYDYREGMNRDELERDLLTLEPDILPKGQTTIDKFLTDNHKAFILIKSYLPISEFYIEPNNSVSTLVPELCKRESKPNGLPILDKSFPNRKFIRTKFTSPNS